MAQKAGLAPQIIDTIAAKASNQLSSATEWIAAVFSLQTQQNIDEQQQQTEQVATAMNEMVLKSPEMPLRPPRK